MEKHGTEMKDVLIMHFVAKPHTDSNGVLTGVMTTTGKATRFYLTVLTFVRPHIIYKRYRFAKEKKTQRSNSRYVAYNFIELFASSGQVGPGA